MFSELECVVFTGGNLEFFTEAAGVFARFELQSWHGHDDCVVSPQLMQTLRECSGVTNLEYLKSFNVHKDAENNAQGYNNALAQGQLGWLYSRTSEQQPPLGASLLAFVERLASLRGFLCL